MATVLNFWQPECPLSQGLLGFHGIHPRFWLFTSRGRFVARLCSYRLQATGDTAQGAIEALRQSVRQYAKVYGTHDLGGVPSPIPPQVPLRVADELAEQEQRADVEWARQRFGFWHCASTVTTSSGFTCSSVSSMRREVGRCPSRVHVPSWAWQSRAALQPCIRYEFVRHAGSHIRFLLWKLEKIG